MVAIEYCGNYGEARRCDAKCHDAEGPDCECVCGGVLHGQGERLVEAAQMLCVMIDDLFGVRPAWRQAGLFDDG